MTDNRTTELLPCPFCGGEAVIVPTLDTTVREWFVTCGNLECSVLACRTKRYYTEAEAIAAWNTRATVGNGTCENANKDGYGFRFDCAECGYSTIVLNCATRLDELPSFCPECGRKVKR